MALRTGALIISRGNYEISKKAAIDEYYNVLLPLYEKYGYKPALRGMKSADVHGFTIQMFVGMGFFPSEEKAIQCHEDNEYKKVITLRDKFMTDYQLTLFGKPDLEVFSGLDDGYKLASGKYEEDMCFIVYRNDLEKSKISDIKNYADKMTQVMSKYYYEPFYYGKKIKDIDGTSSTGDYMGLGFFPNTLKAKECFIDDEYYDLTELREKFTKDFNTTIYGPVR